LASRHSVLFSSFSCLPEQNVPPPDHGQNHQHDPDREGYPGNEVIVLKPSQLRKDDFPVMVILDLAAGNSPQKHKLARPGIVHIGGDIKKTLPQPPQPDRGAERIALGNEGAEDNERNQPLPERPPQDLDEPAERGEKDMSRFMEGKIDQVHEGLADQIRLDSPRDQTSSPDPQQKEEYPSADQKEPVFLRLDRENAFRQPWTDTEWHGTIRDIRFYFPMSLFRSMNLGEYDPAPNAFGAAVGLLETAFRAGHHSPPLSRISPSFFPFPSVSIRQ
jgi:hypothetical protein